jgi:hypothetical protein
MVSSTQRVRFGVRWGGEGSPLLAVILETGTVEMCVIDVTK